MLRNATLVVILLLAIGGTGIASAQFGSTMYVDESEPTSTPYEPGDKVSVDVVLNMDNVERYNSKLKFDDKYLDFYSITMIDKHDVYADPGQSGTVYVGGQAGNSSITDGNIDTPKLRITFEVKDDIKKQGSVRSNIKVENSAAVVNGDRVTDIMSQGTVIDIDTGERERAFEVGIEMTGSKEIQRGESLTVDAYASNSFESGGYQGLDLQLVVDKNKDGFFSEGEIVKEKTVDMRGSQDSFQIKYQDVDLPEGGYEFQTRLVREGDIERSYTNSTLRVYEKTQNIDVSIYERSVEVGEKVEVPVYVEGGDITEYVLSLKYDSENMDFVSAEGQNFSQPSVNSQDGYVTLSGSQTTNYRNGNVANLIFEGVEEGYSDIEILETDSSLNTISESEINASYSARGVEVFVREQKENESDEGQNDTYLDINLYSSESDDEGRVEFKTAIESSSQIETIVFDAMANQRQGKVIEYDGYGTAEFSHKYEESGSYVPEVEVTTVSGKTITDKEQIEVDIDQSYTGGNETDDPFGSDQPPLNDSEDEQNETDDPFGSDQPLLNDSEDEQNETDDPFGSDQPLLNDSEDEQNETDDPFGSEQPLLNDSEDEQNETDDPFGSEQPPLNDSEDEENETDDPFGSDQPPLNDSEDEENETDDPFGSDQPLLNDSENETDDSPFNESQESEDVSNESQGIFTSFVSAIGFGGEPQAEDIQQNNESSDINTSIGGEQTRNNSSGGIIEIFSGIFG